MALYIMVKFYMINTLYSHFLVKYCFKKVCIWGGYGVKGEYWGHREHPKQKHRPIFDQHDWRQGEWLGLAGVIGLQGRCCLVSSNPTKGRLRQKVRETDSEIPTQMFRSWSAKRERFFSDTKIPQPGVESYTLGCQDYPSESPEIWLLFVWPSSLLISYSATHLFLLFLGFFPSDFQDLPPVGKFQSQIATVDAELKNFRRQKLSWVRSELETSQLS